ncbi:hypothetical protein BVRB_5g123210 [Beta vulgaris subsp. vulgaris]|uniref:Uncharacterized protein n=1 Tax=Beta vulgaris subsp. vulgaris TaxID=3555 RepID=A0A0J8BD56_BETVV|nr:hypothetical protein BVRB_5g123210 [Beta vulgaris subsp. vulgaris]
MARKLEKTWIIVHDSGSPRGPGTGPNGVPPRAVGGPLKAHSCCGRVMWCRLEALLGLAKGCAERAKGRQKWEENESPRNTGDDSAPGGLIRTIGNRA